MRVWRMTAADAPWAARELRRRREALVPRAPLFWRPAPDALPTHARYLAGLLASGAAVGLRTEAGVLIAVGGTGSWLVDDACVPGDQWDSDGRALWDALIELGRGDSVTFVAPVYEAGRGAFACQAGLRVDRTWWLRELPASGGGAAGLAPEVPGCTATTVDAPPVYAPPGPMLVLSEITDPGRALAAGPRVAARLGCAGVVAVAVAEPAEPEAASREASFAEAAAAAGLRPHCDFYTGVLN